MCLTQRRPLIVLAVLLALGCEAPVIVPTAATVRAASLDAVSADSDDGVARVPSYTIADPGVPAGMLSSVAVNVNNRGDVIGDFRGPRPAPGSFRVNHSFIFTDAMHDLGLAPGTFFSNAFRVNERREVVGQVFTTPVAGPFGVRPLLWTPEQGMVTLPSLANADGYTVAKAINERGDIVGCAYLDDGITPQHMVRWRGKGHVIEDLGTGPDDGGACASAMNERGEIALSVHTDVGNLQAATYDGAYRVIGSPTGTVRSAAAAINARGVVAGVGFNDFAVDNTIAFAWTAWGDTAYPATAGRRVVGRRGHQQPFARRRRGAHHAVLHVPAPVGLGGSPGHSDLAAHTHRLPRRSELSLRPVDCHRQPERRRCHRWPVSHHRWFGARRSLGTPGRRRLQEVAVGSSPLRATRDAWRAQRTLLQSHAAAFGAGEPEPHRL